MIRLALVGDPVAHSLSPVLHRAALDACGLEGEYAAHHVTAGDRSGLGALLQRMRVGEMHGLNVTIPHKRAVMELLDDLTPIARAVGAVNTVMVVDGRVIGDNTDVEGFRAALQAFLAEHHRSGVGEGVCVVLGAGGAAQAVTYALTEDGWQVAVAARRSEQAAALAARFAGRTVQTIDYAELRGAPGRAMLERCTLIVNATPVGMMPDVDRSPWSIALPLPQRAAVYDLVYAPQVTALVRDARGAGLPAATGLTMLIEQARLSFARWTGVTPPRDALRSAVR